MDILRIENVTVCYGDVPAIHHITTHVNCNSLTALIGPNGAGKTTMLRAILGWHPLTSGRILVGDEHAHHHLPRLGYLPQRSSVDWDFPLTVRSVVEQGRFQSLRGWRGFGARDREMVDSALAELRLERVQHRQINELSGGQQQRVFLARAVAQGADIFLLDEPFAGLDHRSQEDLARLLGTWHEQGRTVLAVVHDFRLVRDYFSHAILIRTHLVAEGPVADVMTEANLSDAYGVRLGGMSTPAEAAHG